MNWKRAIITLTLLVLLVAGGYWAYLRYLAPRRRRKRRRLT